MVYWEYFQFCYEPNCYKMSITKVRSVGICGMSLGRESESQPVGQRGRLAVGDPLADYAGPFCVFHGEGVLGLLRRRGFPGLSLIVMVPTTRVLPPSPPVPLVKEVCPRFCRKELLPLAEMVLPRAVQGLCSL